MLNDHLELDKLILFYISMVMTISGVCAFLALTLWSINAPYGRYSGAFVIDAFVPCKIAWFVQEFPAFSVPVICMFIGSASQMSNPANQALIGLFLLHYFQRTFIFPFLMKSSKPTPLTVFLLAFSFCMTNGYLQGRALSHVVSYPESWLADPRFLIGTAIFFTGFAINIHSDHILRNLRKPGETAYKIPHGGLFEYVSGANFFGEIVEWTGFAIACWSPYAAAFAFFTVCNIGPRACQHHRWYQEKFAEDYPSTRRAVIPFIL